MTKGARDTGNPPVTEPPGVIAHFNGGPLDGQTRVLDIASIFRTHEGVTYMRVAGVVAGETLYRCLGMDESAPGDLPIREVTE